MRKKATEARRVRIERERRDRVWVSKVLRRKKFGLNEGAHNHYH